ncbi:MAG: hypothetical protein KDA33_15070, partial [Phycisphaerales bacterium]|nr:hypothetical protein [Phycisphaerales bacterium]
MNPNRSNPCFEDHATFNPFALFTIAIGALLILPSWAGAAPLGSTWTYQGRITDGGVPLNDTADFRFSLWDAEGAGDPPSGGSQLGATMTITNVMVVDGVFTVQLDFGAAVFNGDERWLQIGVRSPAGAGAYTTLSPRQSLTVAPYAQTALTALNADAVPGIDGHSLDAADGNPVDAVFVNNSGRVGIGTSTPADKLTVSEGDLRVERGTQTDNEQAVLTLGGARVGGINPYASVDFSNYDSDSLAIDYIGASIRSHNDDGDTDSGDLRFLTKTTTNPNPGLRMLITPSGSVGIGTSTPEAPLSVVTGNLGIRAANASDGLEYTEIGHGGSNGFINTVGDGALDFRHDGTTMMSLTDTGFLGIGTGAPTSPLGFRNTNERKITYFDNASVGYVGVDLDAGQLRHWAGKSGEFQIGNYNDVDGTFIERLRVDGTNNGGRMNLKDSSGVNRVNAQATANGGQLKVFDPAGGERVRAYVNSVNCGDIQVFGPNGNVNAWMTNLAGSPDHGWSGVFDSAGIAKVAMYVESDGDGWIFTDVLKINGGSDLAEPFDVVTDQPLQPGMVVAIDPDRAGKLRLSTNAYDPTVAGIISGAGGVNPGLMMSQKGTIADGEHPIALSGRVYCWVDADANGPVKPGDLLTTSDTPGHAMKATDHDRAFGTCVGKAMTALD